MGGARGQQTCNPGGWGGIYNTCDRFSTKNQWCQWTIWAGGASERHQKSRYMFSVYDQAGPKIMLRTCGIISPCCPRPTSDIHGLCANSVYRSGQVGSFAQIGHDCDWSNDCWLQKAMTATTTGHDWSKFRLIITGHLVVNIIPFKTSPRTSKTVKNWLRYKQNNKWSTCWLIFSISGHHVGYTNLIHILSNR